MRLIFSLVFCAFLYCQNSQCQNSFDLSGYIKNEINNEPVENAYIFIKGLKKGTLSDAEGQFIFKDIVEGELSLLITNLGFESQEVSVQHRSDLSPSIEIKLKESLYNLPSIVIEAISLTGGSTGINKLPGSGH